MASVAPARKGRRVWEGNIYALLALCALVSIATTIGIIVVLFGESWGFFKAVSVWEFLTGTEWAPNFADDQKEFGVLPLICGTFLVAAIAILIAVPLGLASAIFLSEYAPPWLRDFIKPVLEILAGIPTVVYGYFAITFVTPYLLRPIYPGVDMFNAASAGIVVAIMIIPTICSLCDDALRAVPNSLREAAFALSATQSEVTTRVVLPAALSGVIAAVLLAFARAIGETMAVSMAAGSTAKITLNPFVSVQTMTGAIVAIALGDAPAGSIEYLSIFAIGLALFAITLGINILAQRVLRRFREVYE